MKDVNIPPEHPEWSDLGRHPHIPWLLPYLILLAIAAYFILNS